LVFFSSCSITSLADTDLVARPTGERTVSLKLDEPAFHMLKREADQRAMTPSRFCLLLIGSAINAQLVDAIFDDQPPQ